MSNGAFMATTERIVVADAGPVIHLDEVDALDLLSDFGTVHITQTVWDEVLRHRPDLPSACPWLTIHAEDLPEVSTVGVLARALGLHRGEISALLLCRLMSAELLLCDDSAARLAAESLGFRVRGTLGILLRSLRRGLREKEEVRSLLLAIPTDSTLHIRHSLLEEIIREVEQYERPIE